MSRSCQSATFSSPTTAAARTTRARPQIRSATTGLRLCGIADEPFWPAAERLLHLAAPRCGRDGGSRSRSARATARAERERGEEVGVPVARDDLRRGRLRHRARAARRRPAPPRGRRRRTTPTAPESLPDAASPSSARSSRSRSRSSSNAQPASLAPNVIGSAWTPCVRPTIDRVAVLLRPSRRPRRGTARARRESSTPASRDLERQRRVEHVRGRQPVVEPTPGSAEPLGDGVDERGDVVLGPLLDLGHALGRRRHGARADLLGGLARDDADLGPAVERRELDLEPAGEPALVRPDALHGRTGVAGDHRPDSREPGGAPSGQTPLENHPYPDSR